MRAVALALCLLVVTGCKAQSPGAPGNPEVGGACTSDDECTFGCQRKGNCCNHPYCEQPALASEVRAADAYNREHCTKSDYDRCPQIGSRMPPDYRLELHCRSGACVADKLPLARDAGR